MGQGLGAAVKVEGHDRGKQLGGEVDSEGNREAQRVQQRQYKARLITRTARTGIVVTRNTIPRRPGHPAGSRSPAPARPSVLRGLAIARPGPGRSDRGTAGAAHHARADEQASVVNLLTRKVQCRHRVAPWPTVAIPLSVTVCPCSGGPLR